MDREILFRGKRIDNGEWIESFSIMQLADGTVNLRINPVFSETVCQFSGILDKSGKKLFKGDKVKVWNSQTTPKPILVVTFEDGSFCLRVPGTDDFESAVTFRDALDQAMKANTLPVYEKVGSIFDNIENENS